MTIISKFAVCITIAPPADVLYGIFSSAASIGFIAWVWPHCPIIVEFLDAFFDYILEKFLG